MMKQTRMIRISFFYCNSADHRCFLGRSFILAEA